MTVNKLITPPTAQEQINKINEIIDNLGGGGGSVDSVNGQTGTVVLTATDVGAQPTLVSGTNIKTINGNSILGSGNLQTPYRNIGEIVASVIPLSDAGLHLLDGSLINGSGIYSAFVDYIVSIYDASANYFCTEADWQTAVTTYGVCGKFVYDSVNNTVRLPKYNSKIYTGGGTAPCKGNGITLGLTDGTYKYSISSSNTYTLGTNTSAYGIPVGQTFSGGWRDTGLGIGVTTDPEKSGIIADIANITTSLDGYYYIVIATTTKTEIEVDIDDIATDLNGKADIDLNNCTKPHITDTYVNGTSWYRVYSDGWCEQGGLLSTGDLITFLKEFIDTNYTIVGSEVTSSGSAPFRFANKATTSINFYTALPSCWQACGYIS